MEKSSTNVFYKIVVYSHKDCFFLQWKDSCTVTSVVIIEDAVDIEYVASLYVGILMAVIMAVKASIIA